MKLEMDTDEVFDFEPIKFLRTHSKNKDSTDTRTEVWDCAIEPDDAKSFYTGAHTVATCGGNSLCFIDCLTGTVLAKYYTKSPNISLFSLAWTSLHDDSGRRSILAVGGSKSTLLFFDSAKKCCVLEGKLPTRDKVSINTLYFHKIEKQILFCGSSDGMVCVCKLEKIYNDGKLVDYSLNTLSTIFTDSEILDFTYCLSAKVLLSSSDKGLHMFPFPTKDSLLSPTELNCISLSIVSELRTSEILVDSVESLKDGLIACKYALNGCIYICDLKPIVNSIHKAGKSVKSFEMEPLYVLKWSDTDNYFMHMGVSIESKLLICGDDCGALWIYDLALILERSGEKIVRPTAILPWPNVTDHYNEKRGKLNMDIYDIVINKVVVHSSGHYVVAGTNNNLVCLWKRM